MVDDAKKAIDEADIPGKAKTLGIPSKAGLVSNQKNDSEILLNRLYLKFTI